MEQYHSTSCISVDQVLFSTSNRLRNAYSENSLSIVATALTMCTLMTFQPGSKLAKTWIAKYFQCEYARESPEE